MRAVTAFDVAALIEHRGLEVAAAAERAVRERLRGRGGLIALDARGNFALPFNTEGMYRGWVDDTGRTHTAIYSDVKQWPA